MLIGVLLSVSKIFERILHRLVSSYVDQFVPTFMCGYGKDFSTQQALLLERWQNALDQDGYGGEILMELSKAFDTINHVLLITIN